MINAASLDAMSAYAALQARRNAKDPMPFRTVLTNSVAISTSASAVADPDAAVRSQLADLNTALQAYGINVPPALRMASTDGQITLQDDNRGAAFQRLLADNPSLSARVGELMQKSSSERTQALASVANDFLGKSSASPGITKFLKDFVAAEKDADFSIDFNGTRLTVQEKNGDDWQPVKNKSTFATELLAAYTKYQLQYGVTVEKNDDDAPLTDADIAFRKELAAAAAVN